MYSTIQALYSLDRVIAVAEEAFTDPYQVSVDTHLLVSRRNDLVRLYNPAETNCHLSIESDRRKRLVQVLNYSTKPADYVTVWVNGQFGAALHAGNQGPHRAEGRRRESRNGI